MSTFSHDPPFPLKVLHYLSLVSPNDLVPNLLLVAELRSSKSKGGLGDGGK